MHFSLATFVFAALSTSFISNAVAIVPCILACVSDRATQSTCPQSALPIVVSATNIPEIDGMKKWQIKEETPKRLTWYEGQVRRDGSLYLKNDKPWVKNIWNDYPDVVQVADDRDYVIGLRHNGRTFWYWLNGNDECELGPGSFDKNNLNTVIVSTYRK